MKPVRGGTLTILIYPGPPYLLSAIDPSLLIGTVTAKVMEGPLSYDLDMQPRPLLAELRDEMGLAYLFISHDLSVVLHVADRIAVMYLGRIVEVGPAASLWSGPLHPYTEALLSVVPSIHATHRRTRLPLEGDLPSPLDPPSGCRFRTRCSRATAVCAADTPLMRRFAPDHLTGCHHVATTAHSTAAPSTAAEVH